MSEEETKEEIKEEPAIISDISDIEEAKEPEKFIDVPFEPRKKIDKLTLGNIDGITKIRVRATDNQTLANDTATKIQFSSETYDELDEFDPTTNYRFTADRSGFYLISANLFLDRSVDQKIFALYIKKNGAEIAQTKIATSGIIKQGLSVMDIVELQAGDYIEIYFYQNTGANVYTESFSGANGETCYLNIHQLS